MTGSASEAVVVAGGTGNVGEGIVAELVAQGATVLVPSRASARLDGRAAAVSGPGRMIALLADIGTVDGRDRLRAAARAAGPLRAVVGSLGGFWQGAAVVDLDEGTLQQVLAQGLLAHLRLAQALLPLLSGPGSSLVQINGTAAMVGIPGSSALSISAAAQLALTRSLIAEAAPGAPRVVSLAIDQLVRSRSLPNLPDGALTAREVGAEVARVIAAPAGHGIHRLGKSGGAVELAPLG